MNCREQLCSAKAIDVAWKASRHLYRSADGAIRALRRADGLTAEEAGRIIAVADAVLREAIRIIEPKDEAALEAYRLRVPNGPSAEDRRGFEQHLKSKFPSCTDQAVRAALQTAVVYHIL